MIEQMYTLGVIFPAIFFSGIREEYNERMLTSLGTSSSSDSFRAVWLLGGKYDPFACWGSCYYR